MAEWKESEHPRDNAGKFIDKEGSSSSYRDEVNERIKWAKENNVELPLNNDGSLNDIRLQKIYNEKKEDRIKKPETDLSEVDKNQYNSEISSDRSTAEFTSALTEAKATVLPEDAWRVSSPDTEEFEKEHPNAKKYITKGGSTIAITPDGDIVGVCKKVGDTIRGKDLIDFAVKNGGKKLDAFSGLYYFYRNRGFEPVSWTQFNEEYAPSDWVKGRDEAEPVIFWKYTGNKTELSKEEFLNKVKPSEGYDEAKNVRDKEMDV